MPDGSAHNDCVEQRSGIPPLQGGPHVRRYASWPFSPHWPHSRFRCPPLRKHGRASPSPWSSCSRPAGPSTSSAAMSRTCSRSSSASRSSWTTRRVLAAQSVRRLVARAKPDGYTMLMLVSSHAVAESLYKKRAYDLQQGLPARLDDRHLAVLAADQSRGEQDAYDEGPGRQDPRQTGRHDVRFGRLRRHRAPRVGNDEPARQAPGDARTVQGQRARVDGARRGPRRHDVRPAGVVGIVRQGGQAEAARCHVQDSAAVAPGHTDDGRVRLSRL